MIRVYQENDMFYSHIAAHCWSDLFGQHTPMYHHSDLYLTTNQSFIFTMKKRYFKLFLFKHKFLFHCEYVNINSYATMKIMIQDTKYYHQRYYLSTLFNQPKDLLGTSFVKILFNETFKKTKYYDYLDCDDSLQRMINTFNFMFGV